MENFEIISKLGEGAYSTVFKVKRKIDNQIYALKKVKLSNLNDKEKTNSLTEVRILASVKSKYVISYKEAFFDEKDSTLGIVMEFADNGDLYQKIIEHKRQKTYFEETEVWSIFIQLVKGLKSLHDLRILHRDLKSANVFLFKNGLAKLGDLNVSKVAKRGLGYTQTGTPYYASPEVWKDLPYDNKSDIWSLGCVLYEMITLHPPFRAKNMEELYKKVLSGDISQLPSQFSTDLYEIVSLLIKVNSDKRPNCNDILNNSIIKNRIEFFKNKENEVEIDENEEQNLLKTIHMPKNLLYLSNQLPKPNYKKDKIVNKNNTACEDKASNLKQNIFPKINQKKLPLQSIKQTEETKDHSNIIININNKEDENNQNEDNSYYKGNNSILDVKREIQFYKKLYSINNGLVKPLKKNKSQDKNIVYHYRNAYKNYNYHNHNGEASNNKLYNLYENYTKLKKLQKHKISVNMKNNNIDNKYNLYLKNRNELYKGLSKKISGSNNLPSIKYTNNSCLNAGEGNDSNNIDNKIVQNDNKLSPIIKKGHYLING